MRPEEGEKDGDSSGASNERRVSSTAASHSSLSPLRAHFPPLCPPLRAFDSYEQFFERHKARGHDVERLGDGARVGQLLRKDPLHAALGKEEAQQRLLEIAKACAHICVCAASVCNANMRARVRVGASNRCAASHPSPATNSSTARASPRCSYRDPS